MYNFTHTETKNKKNRTHNESNFDHKIDQTSQKKIKSIIYFFINKHKIQNLQTAQ